jgi:hypothetical protein
LGNETKGERDQIVGNVNDSAWGLEMRNNPRVFPSLTRSYCIAILCISAFFITACATGKRPLDNPVTANDHFLIGARFYSQSRFDDAIRGFSQAIAIDPNHVSAYLWRARAYSLTDPVAALPDWNSAIRLQPKGPNGYLGRSLSYNQLGDVEHALADLNATISIVHVSANTTVAGFSSNHAHFQKAELLFTEGRYSEALPEYLAASESLDTVSVTAEDVAKAFLKGGLPGILLGEFRETSRRLNRPIESAIGKANERIKLCESMVRGANSRETLPAIVKGMSKQAALESVLVTDRVVGSNRVPIDSFGLISVDYPQPECYVTVTKAGPLEHRKVRVLLFTEDDKLAVEKQLPLKDLPVPPESMKNQALFIGSGQPRGEVLETLRSAEKSIYEDDQFVVTVTEYPPAKDKRVRVTMFKDGKVLYSGYGLRPLW